ncbi:MAG: T9SS type A sorting domain-containing protein [Flammeovirgaceae bacterium]|nr:MAG: T9SS type A sorting domain-containing protein [Flammeovirgaceae bacterium]
MRIKRLLIITVLVHGAVCFALAQNDFRSRQSGDWNQASTWEEFIGGTWQLTSNTPTSAAGAITIQSPHIVTVTAGVTIDQTVINSGSTLVVNDGIDLVINNGAGNDLTINGTVDLLGESFLSGAGNMVLNGILGTGSLNSTGALVTGTSVGNLRITGTRTFASGSRVVYEGTGPQFIGSGHPGNFTSGVITEVDNTNGITFNPFCGSNFSGGGSLYIPGDLILTAGNLSIVSDAVTVRTLILTGNITSGSNFISLVGPNVNITLSGSGDYTFPSPTGTQTVGNLTINKPSNTVTFPSPFNIITRLTVSGNVVFNNTGNTVRDLVLNSGSIDFNGSVSITGPITQQNATIIFFEGNSLTMAANYTSAGGVLSSNASSVLNLTGSVAHTSPLTFEVGSQLNTLTLNKSSVGISATINSAVTVTNALNLTAGTLSIVAGNLAMSSGSTITKSNSASISTSSPSGGPWNLIYTGTSQSTGLEIPASGILNALTVNTNSSTTVTLNQDITVLNAFSIPNNARTFLSGSNNVTVGSFSCTGIFSAPTSAATSGLTVGGNFSLDGTFNHNNGTTIFSGSSLLTGSAINTAIFNNVVINSSGLVTAPATLNINGNFTNNGSFTAGSGTVVFRGPSCTLSGTTMDATSFNHVTINSGTTLVPSATFILTGNLTVNGTFNAGSGTIIFNGTTSLSGTNINTTVFNHIRINAARTLTASNINLGVSGNFINNGSFFPGTTGTMNFVGNTVLSGTAINTTDFVNIVINGGASLTGSAVLRVQGNYTNNGTFNAGSGVVYFSGNTGSRVLTGTTNTLFYDITLDKTNGGTSLTVSSPQTVTNSLTLTRGILSNPSSNLAVSSGGTVTRSSNASITSSSPAGGPWNLVYLTGNQTTGLEIPSSGILSNLTIDLNSGATVSLSQSITVLNTLTIPNSGRSLACGSHNVTTNSFNSSGTFSAPNSSATTGLTVTGNFINNGTFNNNSGTTIFSGVTNLTGSSITTFANLVISGTLNAGVSLAVNRNFTNNGSFSAGTSTVSFTGAVLQTISGSSITTFNNLTVTNGTSPVSVTIESNVNIVGILTLGTSAKLDADGSSDTSVLTLLSTNDSPAQDASIAELPASAQILGSVTVQRFFRPADNFDRFISTPVSNGPVSQLQAAVPLGTFPVTGGFTGTSFPCTGCVNNGHNLRYYREADPGIINQGYKAWIVSSNAETLVPGVGYDAYMWNGVSNTTVSFRGTINRGSINLGIVTTPASNSITHTSNGVPSADGWNLVGNPYPSAIQWNNGPGWNRTNIDPTVWVWDVVGRVWHSYNANTMVGDLTNGVIALGQGFWVYASTPGSASITINEQAKSVSGSGSYYRQAITLPSLKITLSQDGFADNSFILFDENATEAFDPGMDAPKLQLGIERISVSVTPEIDVKLGHFAIREEQFNDVSIYVFGEKSGEYELSVEPIGAISAIDEYYLVDNKLGIVKKITDGNYKFEMEEGVAGTFSRFKLSKQPIPQTENTIVNVDCYPNPVYDVLKLAINSLQVQSITLLDYSGRVVKQVPFKVNELKTYAEADVSIFKSGVYLVKILTKQGVLTHKVIKH